MTTPFKSIILTLTLCLTIAAIAQTPKSVDYFANIKSYDLTRLWRADSIQIEGDGYKLAFPEPIGFIGDNYQRYYIHYVTVTKSKENPYQYEVYGKTKVKDNVCSFSGTISVRKAMLFKESDDPRYKQGSVICDVNFYEDSSQASSGIIKGTLTSSFCINKKGELYYDAIMFAGDGFSNNECIAIWTSYKTGKSKKCNWGDFRIPDCGDLDIGAGEFSVSNKYVKYGWDNYKVAWSYDTDKPEVKQARKREKEKWWK